MSLHRVIAQDILQTEKEFHNRRAMWRNRKKYAIFPLLNVTH